IAGYGARNAQGWPAKVILHEVDLRIGRGQTVGVIGESGSGKTTIALSLMGHARAGCRIAGGSVKFDGADVCTLSAPALAALRGRKVAYIAQSAAAAFNPSRTILDQVIESALIHRTMTKRAAQAKAVELFRALALPEPETIGRRYPHQVSGGQLQRLMAAMALITDPELVILDEPTRGIDVGAKYAIYGLMDRLAADGVGVVLISSELPELLGMTDRIAVFH
ncbi:ATP-binding cassette domain-containing protein, partial [Pseudomonas sp. SIMBA_041]|uniref:ATP-binding cassette domain-containing protein n=1 Tax=Pseudomonas sp. SIMBA_041 TaxID=3085782 RepID=UPI00397B0D3D